MTEPIVILVATMSGTAEMVADEVADALRGAGWAPRTLRMEKASPELLTAGGLFLICSSTYGTGDVPDNGKPFFQRLGQERPDLSGVRYGVIALGDRTYGATFCGGGRKLDELFAALGARRIGERLQNDARSGRFPEEVTLEWLRGWLLLLDQTAQAARSG